MKKYISKGFTLIELMIVVAIIGILAAVAVPKFADLIDKATEASTKGNLGALRSAISIYYSVEEFTAPDLTACLSPGFIKEIPPADIPFVDTDGDGSKDTSYSWQANAPSMAVSYYARGTADESTDGWAYDSDALEAWIELSSTSLDTKGNPIYLW